MSRRTPMPNIALLVPAVVAMSLGACGDAEPAGSTPPAAAGTTVPTAAPKATGTPCERWKDAQRRFSPSFRSAAPEAQEMRRLMQNKRDGHPLPEPERRKIWAAYFGAQATTYREIATDTTDQRLHDALLTMADDFQQAGDSFGMTRQSGLMEVLQSCGVGADETASPGTGG